MELHRIGEVEQEGCPVKSLERRGGFGVVIERHGGERCPRPAALRHGARSGPHQNRKYRWAMGRTLAGSQVRSSPSARTS